MTTPNVSRPSRARNRALPTYLQAMVANGADTDPTDASFAQVVHSTLLSVAMSGVNRGWSELDFAHRVLDGELGSQVGQLYGGVSDLEARRIVTKTFADAEHLVATGGPMLDREGITAEGRRRVAWVTSWAAAHADELKPNDRALLALIVSRLTDTSSIKVAISRAQFRTGLNLGQTALRNAQRRLIDLGIVRIAERGRPCGPHARERLANVWELVTNDRPPISDPGRIRRSSSATVHATDNDRLATIAAPTAHPRALADVAGTECATAAPPVGRQETHVTIVVHGAHLAEALEALRKLGCGVSTIEDLGSAA